MPKSSLTSAPRTRAECHHPLPDDVELLPWAARQLNISLTTAYRLAATGAIPGLFRVGGQYRVSVPKFFREVHGEES